MSLPKVTLASGSSSRRALLANAGVIADAVKPNIDEAPIRDRMRADKISIRDQAMELAELKALKVSQGREGLVIGGDQMLALGDTAFDKPADLAGTRAHLEALSGQSHRLETAIAVAENGQMSRACVMPMLSLSGFLEPRRLRPAFILAIGGSGQGTFRWFPGCRRQPFWMK